MVKFLGQVDGELPAVSGSQELKASAATRAGEELYSAEVLVWSRVDAALPAADATGSIAATDVLTGHNPARARATGAAAEGRGG